MSGHNRYLQTETLSDFVGLIRATPALTWLLLTKRVSNVAKMMPETAVFNNVWIGASIVNQEEADRDIPKLLAVPAAKRFVSYEPALGPVDFLRTPRPGKHHDWLTGEYTDAFTKTTTPRLDWIIVGGESTQGKHKARPFDLAWARRTIAQCRAAAVPVFVKQLGSSPCVQPDSRFARLVDFGLTLKDRAGADPAEWPEDLRVQEIPS